MANIYYRFFDSARSGDAAQVGRFVELGPDAFADETTHTTTAVKYVRGFITDLRAIDTIQQPQLYEYTVQFILDMLKYEIPHASEKTGAQRMLERHLREVNVDEIPDLGELLDDL